MLKATNIHKSYKDLENELHVLKGIDIEIEKNEIVSIVGPSGAGKSTLLHILGSIDSPDQGEVILEGIDVYDLNDLARSKIRNEKIGFIFQFYHLLPEFNALENVLLPLIVREAKTKIKKLEKKGLDLLDRVGLVDRIYHKPSQLSGGEQQRVAIARALINDPAIILCDEPTGNLDSENGQQIIDLLVNLNKNNEQTLVIVTHDEKIAEVSDRIINIRDGNLI